ncbi:8-hydroxygeraniol dehydrogenase-like [Impatiens glandulifera]|uniref:8-hydroxygeraniol dehydrogenase-like n=1 Tax=Impatiens glandulifera TaxID=253017 RepID=UPI001FB16C2C|nr:8-hydroxygeraniol dehydrogenase-like [Impatiens glandulifera]
MAAIFDRHHNEHDEHEHCGNWYYSRRFSDIIVSDGHFIIKIPDNLPLDAVAPLLYTKIATYSPLRYFGLDKPRTNLGVVVLGRLGHCAVKFTKAFGVNVTIISISISKMNEAIERLCADSFLISSDTDQMKIYGKIILLGAPEKPLDLHSFSLITRRKIVAGSNIWGIKETQEVIYFAAKHGITTYIEVVSIDDVNIAMERLVKGDVRYRFVIDIVNTLKNKS